MSQASPKDYKFCPKCGQKNRATAKNCTQCGFAFFLKDTSGMLRKRCSICGSMNRMGAKICSHCGAAFHGNVIATPPQQQRWCPQCGARRHDNAKVCSQCGYRFKTPTVPLRESPVVQSDDLGEPIAVHSITSAPPVPKPLTETPVVQSNDLGEPIAVHSVTSVPVTPTPQQPPDLNGEPAPYLAPEELRRLRRMGGDRPGLFVRLYQVLRE